MSKKEQKRKSKYNWLVAGMAASLLGGTATSLIVPIHEVHAVTASVKDMKQAKDTKLFAKGLNSVSKGHKAAPKTELLDDGEIITGSWGTAKLEFNKETSVLKVSGPGKIEKQTFVGINKDEVQTIQFEGTDVEAPEDSSELFRSFKMLTTIDGILDTSNVTSMSSMFSPVAPNPTRLNNLNGIKDWDTSKVTNMSSMFSGCSRVSNLDLSKWDTSSVENMKSMFKDCQQLATLDVSDWNTGSVTNMSYMLSGCLKLKNLNGISGFNTSSVTDMSYMFRSCSMPALDLSKWDTSNVTNMKYMFSGAIDSIRTLNVSDWNTSNVTDMSYMFYTCRYLKDLDLSSWDTGNVTTMSEMFNGCGNLKSLTLGEKSIFNSSVKLSQHGPNTDYTAAWIQVENNDEPTTPTVRFENSNVFMDDYKGTAEEIGTYTWEKVSSPPVKPKPPTKPGSGSGNQGQNYKKEAVWREYNPNDGDHLFTKDLKEYESVASKGWNPEGIAFYVADRGTEVYRLYNPNSGEHFYTIDTNEYASVQDAGWRGEGVAFYSLQKGNSEGTPVYRVFNPNATGPGSHHFTKSYKEYQNLVKLGWQDEGVEFYATEE